MKKSLQFTMIIVIMILAIDISAKASNAYDSVTYYASNGTDNCVIGVSAFSTGIFAAWRADCDRMQSVSYEVKGSYEFQNFLGVVESGAFRTDVNTRQTAEKDSATIGSAKSIGYIRDLYNHYIDSAIANAN